MADEKVSKTRKALKVIEEDNAPKSEVIVLVDLAKFQYIGSEPYFHKDAKGRSYTFFPNDIIFISEGEVARYFDYKKTLFKRICDE